MASQTTLASHAAVMEPTHSRTVRDILITVRPAGGAYRHTVIEFDVYDARITLELTEAERISLAEMLAQ